MAPRVRCWIFHSNHNVHSHTHIHGFFIGRPMSAVSACGDIQVMSLPLGSTIGSSETPVNISLPWNSTLCYTVLWCTATIECVSRRTVDWNPRTSRQEEESQSKSFQGISLLGTTNYITCYRGATSVYLLEHIWAFKNNQTICVTQAKLKLRLKNNSRAPESPRKPQDGMQARVPCRTKSTHEGTLGAQSRTQQAIGSCEPRGNN